MKTDIVHELRSLEVRTDVAYHGDESRLFNSTMRAAADEIERLRMQGNGLADRVGSLFRETQELYRHIATQQPWIPVSERLPDVQVNVLLSRPPEHRQSRLRIMRLIDQGYEQYWADDIGYTSPINSYSHWLPLPEPPEVK